ncbi:MAG: ACP S-malonyltransferase [Phycisphaerae bacterium]|nr:ACP S-malonyltransferase [Phycisphaerae bacterium]NIR66999.1 ACP S-malonyltransferase [candidate division Zixibacteria bacterium]NIP54242.1 ACP S-malonyltransferase [Phycisphaerae bacterium]NIS50968.1 ACP S-malonyltransferase [Phycisphaerae bacterium]NIU08627.1 ACP S-malonyltransferase [Phycisphaerae bacterium]
MMKTAFLFPGQGAQIVGMGADIVLACPEAAKIYREANDIVGYDLSHVCFEGPSDKLNTTVISQPAIFVTSAAILEILRTTPETKNITANVTAGLSLGEYTALYAAGVINFRDALILVQKRGLAMQAAADANEGGMVSIIGLDEGRVRQLCTEASQGELLQPVNFNCPGQIVLSGTKEACKRAAELAEKHGAMKAVPLQVAGAFHTEMMASAAEALSEALQQAHISEPVDNKKISNTDIKIIANINADYYQSAEKIREGLTNQLTCPILWQKCMERLLADGVEKFYEIGPGRVLTSLMKRINRKIKVINVSSQDAIKDLVNSEPSNN